MPKYKFSEIAINSTEKKKPTEADKETYIGLEHLDTGCLEVTRYGSEVAPIGEKLVMKKGDVLFGKRRAYQKKVAIAPFDGIFSAHGMVLRPNERVITREFFPFFISSDYFLEAAIKISVGSLSPTINWRDLRELEFEIPEIEQQRSLSQVFWAINTAKKAYKDLLNRTDALIQSQFVEMFGTIKNNIYGYPIGTIEDAAHDIYAGGDKPTDTSDTPTDTYRYPVYSNGETDCGLLCYAKTYRTTKIAITVSARGTIGFCAIREPLFTPVVRLITVEPKDGMDIRYLFTAIDQMQLVSTGTSQGQLTVPNFKKMPIILPPTEAQKQFASFAEQLDKSKFAAKQALSDLEEMQKALMLRHLG